MKYEFYEDEFEKLPFYKDDIIEGKNYYVKTLDFRILDENYILLESLGRLTGEYVRDIVDKMEQVRDEELDTYGFGAEDSVGVIVNGKTFKNEQYKDKCFIFKAFTDLEIEIPFDEIYTLMRDYRDEIIKWEEKTGMEKPGW